MGKFVISEAKTGFKFNLKATNGQIIATSQVYDAIDGCKNGVESVKKKIMMNMIKNQQIHHPIIIQLV